MASRSRDGDKPLGSDLPRELANVTPTQAQMLDHSFTLQSIMEVQRAIGAIDTKVDRLIQDVGEHGRNIDDVRHKVSFVKGVVWVLGFAVAGLAALAIAFLTGKINVTVLPN